MCMHICACVSSYACTCMCVCLGAHKGWKESIGSPSSGVRGIVSHWMWVLGTRLQSFVRIRSSTEPSLQILLCLYAFIYLLCVVTAYAMAITWTTENSLLQSFLSFYHVGPKDQIKFILQFGSKVFLPTKPSHMPSSNSLDYSQAPEKVRQDGSWLSPETG